MTMKFRSWRKLIVVVAALAAVAIYFIAEAPLTSQEFDDIIASKPTGLDDFKNKVKAETNWPCSECAVRVEEYNSENNDRVHFRSVDWNGPSSYSDIKFTASVETFSSSLKYWGPLRNLNPPNIRYVLFDRHGDIIGSTRDISQ